MTTSLTGFIFILLVIPSTVFAAPQTFAELVDIFLSLINIAVVVMIAIAILGFFWGISKFIFSAQDSTKIAEGKTFMMWSILALFVMVSVWGILGVLKATFL